MAFTTEKPGNDIHEWRVIDYSRNITLKALSTAGMAEGTYFEMNWNGKIVNFYAKYKATYTSEGNIDELDWRLLSLPIPQEFDETQAKHIVIEAFHEFGELYNKELVNVTRVHLPTKTLRLL